jgi:hypothetical protein
VALKGFAVFMGFVAIGFCEARDQGSGGKEESRDKGLRWGSANTASANGGEEESSDKGLKWGNYKYVFVERR